MSIAKLYTELETTAGLLTPTTTYLRATSKEANLDLEEIDIDTPMAISVDQTTMVMSVGGGTYESLMVPIEVFFVEKQASQDETLSDNDAIVDRMVSLATQFYQFLSQSTTEDLFDPTQPFEAPEMERLQAYELYDTVVTGVLFTLDYHLDVTEYNCRP